jgi:hypothetical protein
VGRRPEWSWCCIGFGKGRVDQHLKLINLVTIKSMEQPIPAVDR